MQIMDCKKMMDIYLPHYFKVGNIFSEEFVFYSIKQAESQNECPMLIYKSNHTKLCEFHVKCEKDVNCGFFMQFIELKGEKEMRGYQLSKINLAHNCKKISSSEEKQIVKQRKAEIESLKPMIMDLLQERIPIFGCQPSKNIMALIALKLDRYPNFLYRGINRELQKKIKKRFDNEVFRMKRRFLERRKYNRQNEFQLDLSYKSEIDLEESDSSIEDSSFGHEGLDNHPAPNTK